MLPHCKRRIGLWFRSAAWSTLSNGWVFPERHMAGKILISYRRADEPGFAAALYSRLEEEFPSDLVMDVETRWGEDFVKELKVRARGCGCWLPTFASNGKNLIGE